MPFNIDLLKKCWFLSGPTACGKTAVSLELARRLNAEIVSLDSMTLYRGMDTGTAKPTPVEQHLVPHHLIDLLEPWEEYSVAEYLHAAEMACARIVQRGRIPLFVGGTGLYLRGVLRGVFAGPGADWAFRRQLEGEAAVHSPEYLHRRLQEVDAATANRLHSHDLRRIIRALEIHHLTGKPASIQHAEVPLPVEDRPQHVYWLSPPRDWLHARIDERVVQMIDAGWVEEARRLMQSPHPLSRTASRALGYNILFAHLQGQYALPKAIGLIQTRTRQFAKRQHTWFRNLVECRAIELTGDESAVQVAERLVSGGTS